MKILMACIALWCAVVTTVWAESEVVDARDWYVNHYGSLWKQNAWEKFDEVVSYYDETVTLHPPDGESINVASRPWLAELFEQWRREEWVGSDIAGLEFDQINPTTALFKSRWRDWYADGREEFSCAWYVADFKGGRWVFTQFGIIDCVEHEL